jgi:hypothetical protein
MRLNHGMIALMLSSAAFVLPMTGCAGGSLVYDSDWRDYHRWNRDENRYYWQWEIRTHRDHQAFQRRSPGDQLEYLGWRHK